MAAQQSRARDDRTPEIVLRHATETIATAFHGLDLMRSNTVVFRSAEVAEQLDKSELLRIPTEVHGLLRTQRQGLRIGATFGAATMDALAGLRHRVDGYDEWCAPIEETLRSDVSFTLLRAMRHGVIHRGNMGRTRSQMSFLTDGDKVTATASLVAILPAEESPEEGLAGSEQLLSTHMDRYLSFLNDAVAGAWEQFCPGVTPTDETFVVGLSEVILDS